MFWSLSTYATWGFVLGVGFLIAGETLLRMTFKEAFADDRAPNGEVIEHAEGPAEAMLSTGLVGVVLSIVGLVAICVSSFALFS